MLPIDLVNKGRANISRFTLLIFITVSAYLKSILVYAQNGTAAPPVSASGVSAVTMLENIATQIPNLMRLVTAIAYVMGMYSIIHGIVGLKHMGESRTMMSREHSLTGPLVWIVTGAALLYLPSAVQVGMSTFWTQPCPYCYQVPSDAYGQFLSVCFLIIQFVGTVGFIRGLVILSHLGGQGGQQGALSKGLLHIIGGIFCINIYQFVQVVMYTFGLSLQVNL